MRRIQRQHPQPLSVVYDDYNHPSALNIRGLPSSSNLGHCERHGLRDIRHLQAIRRLRRHGLALLLLQRVRVRPERDRDGAAAERAARVRRAAERTVRRRVELHAARVECRGVVPVADTAQNTVDDGEEDDALRSRVVSWSNLSGRERRRLTMTGESWWVMVAGSAQWARWWEGRAYQV